jgi:hypothetical protein
MDGTGHPDRVMEAAFALRTVGVLNAGWRRDVLR